MPNSSSRPERSGWSGPLPGRAWLCRECSGGGERAEVEKDAGTSVGTLKLKHRVRIQPLSWSEVTHGSLTK